MNTELNKAIFEVITANYKYDCEDAYKMVKKAGYYIHKEDGYFIVYSPVTSHSVHGYCHRWKKSYYFVLSGRTTQDFDWDKPIPVDFVAHLDKKPNRDWFYARDYNMNCRGKKAFEIEDMHHLKYSLKSRTDRLLQTKEALNRIVSEYVDRITEQQNAVYETEQRLEEFRRRNKLGQYKNA